MSWQLEVLPTELEKSIHSNLANPQTMWNYQIFLLTYMVNYALIKL